MRFNSIVDAIGHTPVVRLRLEVPDGVEVYAKLELQNLFAMKDRVARQAILEARRTGALVDGAPIIESSSGTMALGLALVGNALGHEVHIVTDPRIDPITLAKLTALGCRVHVVTAMSNHGWQSARLELLERLQAGLPGAFWPQQYSNPDNPLAYTALAAELIEDLGHLDVLVGSVGSGGSLCGSARALRRVLPALRVVGVDCVGSVLFGQPDQPHRLQSGLGNSLRPKNLDRTVIDEVHWLNDREAFAATRDLARGQQIFGGNTSGSVYQVLRHIGSRARRGARIVGIFPDRGDRYVSTAYSDEYWAEHGLDRSERATAPLLVSPGAAVSSWSRADRIEITRGPRKLLFVEANTTGTGVLSLYKTRELGLEPVLLTSRPARYRGLDEVGCQVLECDTNSLVELCRVVLDRFTREELAGITTTSEFYLPAATELSAWLGLPGNGPEAIATCRDKARVRVALAEAGLSQPWFTIIRHGTELALPTLPCVVKPVDDSGSNDVLLCTTMAEVAAHVRHILGITANVRDQPAARTAVVEEFLDAPEYSVEMFSWNGETTCVGITEKIVTGLPYFVESGHIFPAALPPAVADDIAETVRRALKATGVDRGATHTEVKLTGQGPIIVEINARLAGGMIPELIRLATGIDLLEQQLRAFVSPSLLPQLRPSVARYAGIRFVLPPCDGMLVEVLGQENARAVPGVDRVTVTAAPGTKIRVARNAYDRLGFVIAIGDTPQQVAATLDLAQDLLRVEVG